MSLIIIRSHAEACVYTYKRIYDVYTHRRIHPYTINTHLSCLMQRPLGPAFVCHGPPCTANVYPMLIPVDLQLVHIDKRSYYVKDDGSQVPKLIYTHTCTPDHRTCSPQIAGQGLSGDPHSASGQRAVSLGYVVEHLPI
jgi:hypothetical protein